MSKNLKLTDEELSRILSHAETGEMAWMDNDNCFSAAAYGGNFRYAAPLSELRRLCEISSATGRVMFDLGIGNSSPISADVALAVIRNAGLLQ